MLWRLLPGPTALRLLFAVVLVAGVVAVCFLVVFPHVDAWLAPVETFGRR